MNTRETSRGSNGCVSATEQSINEAAQDVITAEPAREVQS